MNECIFIWVIQKDEAMMMCAIVHFSVCCQLSTQLIESHWSVFFSISSHSLSLTLNRPLSALHIPHFYEKSLLMNSFKIIIANGCFVWGNGIIPFITFHQSSKQLFFSMQEIRHHFQFSPLCNWNKSQIKRDLQERKFISTTSQEQPDKQTTFPDKADFIN